MPLVLSQRLVRLVGLAALALIGLLAQIAVAWAHASLISTDPRDGAVVAAAPSTYSLTFSEPVSPLSLKLVRPDGASTPLDRFEVKDRTVEIAAPADLAQGTHVLSWRVTSADGHPVGGSVVFSIGAATAVPLSTGEQIDWVVRAGVLSSKLALYLGLFVGIGGAFASRWLLGGVRTGRRAVAAALGVGLLGIFLSLGFQGLDALDERLTRINEFAVWSTAMATSLGRTAAIAIMGFTLAAAALLARGWTSRISSLAALLCVGAALSLSGHVATAEPQWLMRTAVFLHAIAIAYWVGALVPLGLALKRGDPAAAAALRRFSATIPYVVLVLVAAGVVLAVVQVREPGALVGTAYGNVLIVKLLLVAGLFLLAAFNRWHLTVPALAGGATATYRLIRSIAAETVIVLLILTVAACWRFTPPPRTLAAMAARPATEHIHTDRAMALIEVLPGRAGPVDISINILTGEYAALDAKEVTLVLSKPDSGIEPFRRAAVRDDETNWRIDQAALPLPGTWHVRVEILVSDFEKVRLDGEIGIEP
ncbi:copper transport protein [Sinorhizobium kostiense]|uniref:Copper transport protein n=1 Tax=Sinorhizobium kostiense TaxID=76747 RepID=A0ABS4R6F4_9HYPH|nr:copper resistance CopC/CopD family protein [Sinorhizobium kostiense]MBP2238467.1 copper transport protein [Sinorhizobium kostiense]